MRGSFWVGSLTWRQMSVTWLSWVVLSWSCRCALIAVFSSWMFGAVSIRRSRFCCRWVTGRSWRGFPLSLGLARCTLGVGAWRSGSASSRMMRWCVSSPERFGTRPRLSPPCTGWSATAGWQMQRVFSPGPCYARAASKCVFRLWSSGDRGQGRVPRVSPLPARRLVGRMIGHEPRAGASRPAPRRRCQRI